MNEYKFGDVIRCDPIRWNDERRWMIVSYDLDTNIYTTVYLADKNNWNMGLIPWSGMILADGFVRAEDPA